MSNWSLICEALGCEIIDEINRNSAELQKS